jgi:hypothetical protein
VKRYASYPIALAAVLSAVILSGASGHAQTHPLEGDRFAKNVTGLAEQYIGTPCCTAEDGGLDNSHLFHLIYQKAAQESGWRYLGYAPMKQLLKRTEKIPADDIQIGDLIVLEGGLAAMIYKMEDPDVIHFIYVSQKRQRVVSFNNRNLVYDVYWQPNLKGFYRLSRHNFFPNG